MKGFTHEYLPLVGYYPQVQNYMTGVTCEYFQLSNNRLRAVYSLCRTSPTRELSSYFLEAKCITHVCKLGRERYCSYFKTATITFICFNNNHAVFVRFTLVHVCLHLCRLTNLQQANPYNKLKEINATCSYSYQYTEYKHLAMPNRN